MSGVSQNIILLIGIPAGLTPEQALRDNRRYAAVWEVLQALRAHDGRFNAIVNRIELVKQRDAKINIIGVPAPQDRQPGDCGRHRITSTVKMLRARTRWSSHLLTTRGRTRCGCRHGRLLASCDAACRPAWSWSVLTVAGL